MMNDIFISYSRHDSNVVNELVAMLEQEGYSVWIDHDGIESGEDFKRVIYNAIVDSKLMLFFSSKYSNASEWTAKEVGVAVYYKKHIIPIKLDDSKYNASVGFDLVNLDFIDYSKELNRLAKKEKLLKTLRNKLGKKNAKNPICPEGTIKGVFSVSPTKKVYFSKGNLQYHILSKTWRFAEKQYEIISEGNGEFGYVKEFERVGLFKKELIEKIATDKRTIIDLFGWGTGNAPTNYSTDNSDYQSFVDWGQNKISNGGNQTNLWCTLTMDEWTYLFEKRQTASGIRFAKAKVNGVNGVLMLPDDWNKSQYVLKNANVGEEDYDRNVISAIQWTMLENAGAVFLPAAGKRVEEGFVFQPGFCGYYWAATYYSGKHAYYQDINGASIFVSYHDRYYGMSVRLVCPVE